MNDTFLRFYPSLTLAKGLRLIFSSPSSFLCLDGNPVLQVFAPFHHPISSSNKESIFPFLTASHVCRRLRHDLIQGLEIKPCSRPFVAGCRPSGGVPRALLRKTRKSLETRFFKKATFPLARICFDLLLLHSFTPLMSSPATKRPTTTTKSSHTTLSVALTQHPQQ